MAQTVPITIGGKERRIKFGVNAIADIDQTAPGFWERWKRAEASDYAASRLFIWAGLKHEWPRLTLEQAGEILETEFTSGRLTVADVISACIDAFVASGLFKKAEDGDSDPNGQPEAPKNGVSGNGSMS